MGRCWVLWKEGTEISSFFFFSLFLFSLVGFVEAFSVLSAVHFVFPSARLSERT
jgi:hypothetical protein